MIHPLLHLIATKPQLLGDHVEAYAELVGAEVGKTSKMWIMRVVFYAVAAVPAVGRPDVHRRRVDALGGRAVRQHELRRGCWSWCRWCRSSAGAFCVMRRAPHPTETPFQTVKQQLSADMAMLREVSAAT